MIIPDSLLEKYNISNVSMMTEETMAPVLSIKFTDDNRYNIPLTHEIINDNKSLLEYIENEIEKSRKSIFKKEKN
ncbi:MAG: hypothetical protein ACOC3V_03705 [bacterium]